MLRVSKRQEELKLEDFKLILVLGRGAFGKVYLAKLGLTDLNDDEEALYAIKSIRKDVLLDENKIDSTVMEKSILLDCEHPFLASMDYMF